VGEGRSRLAERITQIRVRGAATPSGIDEVLQFLASPRTVFFGGETLIVDAGTTMVRASRKSWNARHRA
jgi:hypothetical protein